MRRLEAAELDAVNRRASECGAAVEYTFERQGRARHNRRLRVVRARVMTSAETQALGREVKAVRAGNA